MEFNFTRYETIKQTMEEEKTNEMEMAKKKTQERKTQKKDEKRASCLN